MPFGDERNRETPVHLQSRARVSARSGRFEGREAFFNALGLGLDVLEIGFPGLRLGPQLAQVALQLSDALSPAAEPPPEALRMFRVVTMVFMAAMMLTRAVIAGAAFSLAATLAPAGFLAARALAATLAACLLAVTTVPTPVLAVVATATLVSALASSTTSAMSAHRFQPPVVI
jgi:hypothetical protein